MTEVKDEADGASAGVLLVQNATWQAEGIVSLRLVDPGGGPLPPWRPGAHIDLVLPSGLIRQYSLCGPPEDTHGYTVAVLLDTDGRGGSREVHETPLVGRTVSVRGPRNRFPLVSAARYVFVAGGIGITPILAMARELSSRGADWSFVYGGRSRSTMAFAGELAALGAGRTQLVPQDESGLPDLDAALARATPGTAVYCCGPEGLLAAVQQRCAALGTRAGLYVERFGAPTGGGTASGGGDLTTAFEVELRRSGNVLTVPADRSILDVVRDIAPQTPSSCEEGFCGTCETRVLEGVPEHGDSILSEKERETGRTMMICVGRSRTPRLVLDL
ncbi:PDR/VanB family oxidoreductase [Streptomyces microflavus]|uniref:PDR/VanB family oxidoreductase n=1 Tax=Streptomyces microflavus TaxID=1919 RepID=UPI0033EA73D9